MTARGPTDGVAPQPYAELTTRERQVLAGVADGLSAREIALQLGIAAKTVVHHKERLRSKLRIARTAGLIRYALERQYLSLQVTSGNS